MLFPALAVLGLALALPAASAPGDVPRARTGRMPAPEAPRATYPSQRGDYQVDTIASGLSSPWSVALLPDGGFLVTEKAGRLRRISANGTVSAPITGMPAVWASGQGGLLDVVLSPQFEADDTIYFSYAEAGSNATAGTAVARATLGATSVSNVQVLFRQVPKLSGGNHFGSRLAFGADGNLFITVGERFDRMRAQRLDGHQGKVVRIRPDGSIPRDNPFRGPRTRNEIWSYGHRNPQSAAVDPRTGQLWTAEHGPRGGDEINLPRPGRNYGWPLATHGFDYGTGQPYPETIGTSVPGMEDPHRVWPQSPGFAGMAFLVGQPGSTWNDNLFMGALAQRNLVRLELDGNTVVGEERLLTELNARIRDVRAGPDGRLYVLDESNGRLLRITPP
jgi:glucose/arabinose dehydrogenase